MEPWTSLSLILLISLTQTAFTGFALVSESFSTDSTFTAGPFFNGLGGTIKSGFIRLPD